MIDAEIQPLYTSSKLNLGDRVMRKVEENSFTLYSAVAKGATEG